MEVTGVVERTLEMNDVTMRCEGDSPQNPFIKRLLRNYQESAEHSLEGPRSAALLSDGGNGVATVAKVVQVDEDRGRPGRGDTGPAGGPIPGGLAAELSRLRGDPHRRVETCLEGECISCFVVGGERRLCVPQLLNTVFSQFSLSEIHTACDCLRIHISLADGRQLTLLRRDGILPQSAHRCGLVTLTDAQRLCAVLLGNQRRMPPTTHVDEPSDAIPVVHRCFGKCAGSLRPSTGLVCCAACRHEFDVEQFVCHSHGDHESRTCHWGFDAANWRAYLQLAPDMVDDERLQDCLDYFKHHACDHFAAAAALSNCRKRHEVGLRPSRDTTEIVLQLQ